MSTFSGMIHLRRLDGMALCGRSLAGKTSVPIRVTDDETRVTCNSCLRCLRKGTLRNRRRGFWI